MFMVIDTKTNTRHLLLDASDMTAAKAQAVEIRGKRPASRYVLRQYDHHQLVRNELSKHGQTSRDFSPRFAGELQKPVPKGMHPCQRCRQTGMHPRPGMTCFNCEGLGYMTPEASKECGEVADLYHAATVKAEFAAMNAVDAKAKNVADQG